jgi:hypothetical protein
MDDALTTTDPASVIAARASEAMQELCYDAQMTFPDDVYDVLGLLETLAEGLSAVCGQLGTWLEEEAENGRLQVIGGPFAGDVPAAIATVTYWQHHASGLAEQLRLALGNAHLAARGLRYT